MQSLPWRWPILSIILAAGRGISTEICGLDDVFPLNDFGSYPFTQFIIIFHTMYHSCILNKLFLRDIYIPRVGVDITLCGRICNCYSYLPGFNCIFQLYCSGIVIS